MKKHLTHKTANITWHGSYYSIPIKIIKKYKMTDAANESSALGNIFGNLLAKYGEPAVLLKGLRIKEGFSQVAFAKELGMTQQNLSAMENGRRSIGKEIAKRIAKKFGVDYRLFL